MDTEFDDGNTVMVGDNSPTRVTEIERRTTRTSWMGKFYRGHALPSRIPHREISDKRVFQLHLPG